MRRTRLFLWMGVLNLLGAVGIPLLTSALIGICRMTSMSAFSDLVHTGVIVIDEQKSKSYRNEPLSGDWGDVSLYITTPFLGLTRWGYTAAGILLVNALTFLSLWWHDCNVAQEDRARMPQASQS